MWGPQRPRCPGGRAARLTRKGADGNAFLITHGSGWSVRITAHRRLANRLVVKAKHIDVLTAFFAAAQVGSNTVHYGREFVSAEVDEASMVAALANLAKQALPSPFVALLAAPGFEQ